VCVWFGGGADTLIRCATLQSVCTQDGMSRVLTISNAKWHSYIKDMPLLRVYIVYYVVQSTVLCTGCILVLLCTTADM
jgi:hypothetical protein